MRKNSRTPELRKLALFVVVVVVGGAAAAGAGEKADLTKRFCF